MWALVKQHNCKYLGWEKGILGGFNFILVISGGLDSPPGADFHNLQAVLGFDSATREAQSGKAHSASLLLSGFARKFQIVLLLSCQWLHCCGCRGWVCLECCFLFRAGKGGFAQFLCSPGYLTLLRMWHQGTVVDFASLVVDVVPGSVSCACWSLLPPLCAGWDWLWEFWALALAARCCGRCGDDEQSEICSSGIWIV